MNLVTLETLNRKCFPEDPRPMDELQRWCRKRVLPALKIGGTWFVDLDKLGDEKEAKKQDFSPVAQLVIDKMRNGARN